LRDCKYAIDAGDTIFAPRMKRLLLRAFVTAKRRKDLAASTRRSYLSRLNRDLDAIMARPVKQKDGRRLRKRYAKHRGSLFTFLEHPEIAPDNNSSERTLRPTATYRKVTGGFRSNWGPTSTPGFAPLLVPPPNKVSTPSTPSVPHCNRKWPKGGE
jgi:transposase